MFPESEKNHWVGAVRNASGMTLLECVLAMGLMAMAMPVLLLAFGQSHRDLAGARVEAWAGCVIPARLADLRLSGGIRPGGVRAWAHGLRGESLGEVDEESCRQGVACRDGNPAAFLLVARGGSMQRSSSAGAIPMTMNLEYPAAAPADHRRKISFHTQTRPCED